jgi:hypothetical protein
MALKAVRLGTRLTGRRSGSGRGGHLEALQSLQGVVDDFRLASRVLARQGVQGLLQLATHLGTKGGHD